MTYFKHNVTEQIVIPKEISPGVFDLLGEPVTLQEFEEIGWFLHEGEPPYIGMLFYRNGKWVPDDFSGDDNFSDDEVTQMYQDLMATN